MFVQIYWFYLYLFTFALKTLLEMGTLVSPQNAFNTFRQLYLDRCQIQTVLNNILSEVCFLFFCQFPEQLLGIFVLNMI